MRLRGITFGVLGAFYGLVLAFVIVATWERFSLANTNAHQEATALESLYKLGAGFFPTDARSAGIGGRRIHSSRDR